MTFTTWNHTYSLIDVGDGGFLISGHPKYCPVPTLCKPTKAPVVGERFVADIIITTPVVEINDAPNT